MVYIKGLIIIAFVIYPILAIPIESNGAELKARGNDIFSREPDVELALPRESELELEERSIKGELDDVTEAREYEDEFEAREFDEQTLVEEREDEGGLTAREYGDELEAREPDAWVVYKHPRELSYENLD